MSKLAKLKLDKQTGWYHCKHKLEAGILDVNIDASEESIDLAKLTSVAQSVIDDWPSRHQRLVRAVAEELVSQGYLDDSVGLSPSDCRPFYLRVTADADGEISYNVAYNVPSLLATKDDYVDVEEEVGGEWMNVEVCSTE